MQKLVVSFTHIVIGMTGTVFTEKNKGEDSGNIKCWLQAKTLI